MTDELDQYISEQVDDLMDKVGVLKEKGDYQAYFKSMLKKWNIKSPMSLPKDKKKEFFNALSSGWKKEKGGVAEGKGPGGHIPDGSGPPEYGKGAGPGGGKQDGSGLEKEEKEEKEEE